MKEKKKPKNIIDVESEDDWCFICKDGGELTICEYEDCNKVYHASCVQEEAFCTELEDGWTCDRHICSRCRSSKTPRFNCFCCPYAVCKKCVYSSKFLRVKHDSGFCRDCLDLVQLGEEENPCDDDGNPIDFKDRNTHEGLFKEYLDIIKKKEGLTMNDIHAAINKEKKKKSRKRGSVSGNYGICHSDDDEDDDDDDDCILLKYDEEETKSCKPSGKKKVSKRQRDEEDGESYKPSSKKKVSKGDEEVKESCKPLLKRKKVEELKFSTWGSKPLIRFLKSIGTDTTGPLSASQVEKIIKSYIQEKKLVDQEKKRKVRCDDMLYSVFKKKILPKRDIYYLLDDHIAEEPEALKNDDVSSDEKDEDDDIVVGMDQRTWSSGEESQDKKVDTISKPSGFASIVSDNIKLVYLRRSLVEELMKQPKEFERKVIGSFIRIKSDAKNCKQRHNNQLLPVTGVEKSSIGEIFLKVSSTSKGIRVCTLSDSGFTEEECQNLRENIGNGVLKKIPVVELEEKARSLHEDVTKHWIKTELIFLQHRIDYANEKGRRQELNDYAEQREKLGKPCYQQKLLQKLPKVIPELVEVNSKTEVVQID